MAASNGQGAKPLINSIIHVCPCYMFIYILQDTNTIHLQPTIIFNSAGHGSTVISGCLQHRHEPTVSPCCSQHRHEHLIRCCLCLAGHQICIPCPNIMRLCRVFRNLQRQHPYLYTYSSVSQSRVNVITSMVQDQNIILRSWTPIPFDWRCHSLLLIRQYINILGLFFKLGEDFVIALTVDEPMCEHFAVSL